MATSITRAPVETASTLKGLSSRSPFLRRSSCLADPPAEVVYSRRSCASFCEALSAPFTDEFTEPV
jgi:hypothetical protein